MLVPEGGVELGSDVDRVRVIRPELKHLVDGRDELRAKIDDLLSRAFG